MSRSRLNIINTSIHTILQFIVAPLLKEEKLDYTSKALVTFNMEVVTVLTNFC